LKAPPNTVRLRILRFDPRTGVQPHYDSFDVQMKPRMTVLDALYEVLDNQDGTLAFRSSCRSSVCGSCAMFINGHQRLACNTQASVLGKNITIGPLPHLPVIRDLVVDLHLFFHKMDLVKPYFEGRQPYPVKEFIQSQEEREALDIAIDCVDCGACFSACPMSWTDQAYPGPAAFVKAYRFIADTRDSAQHERLGIVGCEDGVWRCHTVFNCSDACPKSVNPTYFIQYLKRKTSVHVFHAPILIGADKQT
jgi:succinate dehydrogenase / fumarate reductase iron-sulfur subunit